MNGRRKGSLSQAFTYGVYLPERKTEVSLSTRGTRAAVKGQPRRESVLLTRNLLLLLSASTEGYISVVSLPLCAHTYLRIYIYIYAREAAAPRNLAVVASSIQSAVLGGSRAGSCSACNVTRMYLRCISLVSCSRLAHAARMPRSLSQSGHRCTGSAWRVRSEGNLCAG